MIKGKRQNNLGSAAGFLAAVLFCLLFLSPNIPAAALSDYHANLISAETATNELLVYTVAVIDGERSPDAVFERQALAAIRRNLPATEKIEWEGSVVETANQWLETKLKDFEAAANDWTKRRRILTEIGERLAAIDAKIVELRRAPVASRTKDEDKQKLAEILRRVEYLKPEEKEKSWFARMQERIRKWFNEKFPETPPVPETTSPGMQTLSLGLQILLYVLVLGFIAFLIYRFAPFFGARFRRREKEERGERIILGEKLAADENAQTLFDEAEALAQAGNLRGAIRKGYIALLCELSDRKLIGLAQHKTNRDYLRDVRKKQALHRNMNGLTNTFERHWYGFEPADETDWQEFREIYREAIKSEQ